MQRVTIDPEDDDDRWRFVCPGGHRSWVATNHHFWCQSCANSHDPNAEPEFSELVDLEKDRVLERDEVELQGYKAKTA